MKKLLVALILSSGAALAQSPFDGTWVLDMDSAKLPDKVEEYVLDKDQGMFRCCGSTVDIKADGQDQRVGPTSYYDTESVRVVDAHTVEVIAKKAGKPMFAETDTISPDGNTLTQETKDTTEAEAVTVETLYHRVDPAPAGSHIISGSWRAYKITRSKNGATINYKCTASSFSAETLLGEKYEAKFDGKEYPVEDDPGRTMVSVKLLSSTAVEVTSKRNGRVVGVSHMAVAPDGQSIHVVFENKDSETTTTFEMRKQPSGSARQ